MHVFDASALNIAMILAEFVSNVCAELRVVSHARIRRRDDSDLMIAEGRSFEDLKE